MCWHQSVDGLWYSLWISPPRTPTSRPTL